MSSLNVLTPTSFTGGIAGVTLSGYTTLQAAVDALPVNGGTVIFPPGVYTSGYTLDISAIQFKTVKLSGYGVIWQPGSNDQTFIDLTSANVGGVQDVVIEGFTAYNVGARTGCKLFRVTNTDAVTVRDCRTNNVQVGELQALGASAGVPWWVESFRLENCFFTGGAQVTKGLVFNNNTGGLTAATGVNAVNSAVLNVGDTAGFPASGTFNMLGAATAYTGKTATTFTGCGNHPVTAGGEGICQYLCSFAQSSMSNVGFSGFSGIAIESQTGAALWRADWAGVTLWIPNSGYGVDLNGPVGGSVWHLNYEATGNGTGVVTMKIRKSVTDITEAVLISGRPTGGAGWDFGAKLVTDTGFYPTRLINGDVLAAGKVQASATGQVFAGTAGIYMLNAFDGSTNLWVSNGAGSPAGVVTAPPGSMYLRTDGGAATTLYVKETGTGTAGWAAK